MTKKKQKQKQKQKKFCHICSVININELYSRRIVSACLRATKISTIS